MVISRSSPELHLFKHHLTSFLLPTQGPLKGNKKQELISSLLRHVECAVVITGGSASRRLKRQRSSLSGKQPARQCGWLSGVAGAPAAVASKLRLSAGSIAMHLWTAGLKRPMETPHSKWCRGLYRRRRCVHRSCSPPAYPAASVKIQGASQTIDLSASF